MTSPDVRFAFGKNWSRFLSVLDDERIAEAQRALAEMLETDSLKGRSFLDVGSGSGLHSLVAKRLGADRVHSFDYDAASVACTLELKRRFFPSDPSWTVEQGSILDAAYVQSLGRFDVVYSWGVLHHTGDMWSALANAAQAARPGGRLFIAIYNDQGATSRRWRALKRLYNRSPAPAGVGLTFAVGSYLAVRGAMRRVLGLKNPLGVVGFHERKKDRGMSRWHDLVDWVGGYPFEVAKPEEIFDFCRARGYSLRRLVTVGGGLGNNQFVFERNGA